MAKQNSRIDICNSDDRKSSQRQELGRKWKIVLDMCCIPMQPTFTLVVDVLALSTIRKLIEVIDTHLTKY